LCWAFFKPTLVGDERRSQVDVMRMLILLLMANLLLIADFSKNNG
jgi:hypothetical protein